MDYEEMKQIVAGNVCAVCNGELQIHTTEGGQLEVWCPHHPEHHGYIERQTYTQILRRGMIVHPAIQENIEKKMMPRDDLGRAMNLLALRYPDAIKDPATAALFLMDCARLDLDPLIQPAEAVPIPFKSRKRLSDGTTEEKITVSMIITEDGWLSMAARGCKEEWNGPPRTMRLEDYLRTLKENEGKSLEDIQQIAKAIKESACKDGDAYYYVAIGRSKTMTEDAVVPGWFTKRDMEKADKGHLPSASEPGNQARVRSIKKWIRHVYPECRQKMIELTREWYERSKGVKAAQEYIDAEYRFIDLPEGDTKAGEQKGREGDAQAAFVSQDQEQPALAAEQRRMAWNTVKSLLQYPRPIDSMIIKWFKDHGVDVEMADFGQQEPPDKFKGSILSQFHDALIDWKDKYKAETAKKQ